MKFDDILTEIGVFGWYQKRLFLILTLAASLAGCFTMMPMMLLYTPKHRCQIPGLDNDTYEIQNEAHAALVNLTIPLSSEPDLTYDQCQIYGTLGGDPGGNHGNTSLVKCSQWVYDESLFYDTFTTKANFVCSDSLKIAHITMMCYFGVLVADLILGLLADKVGRKIGLYAGCIVTLVAAVCVTFAPEFYSFAILQFFSGGFSHATFVVISVITMEIVGPNKRIWPGTLLQSCFATGACYITLTSFLIRSWAWINLSATLPTVLCLSYWWLVPESPRWLISKGRNKEATDIIHRAAKVNKVTLPDDMTITKTENVQGSIIDVLRSPVLRKRTLILAFNWIVVAMTYFGVSMAAGNLVGSFFLNFFLIAAVEYPADVLCILLLDRIGRRVTHAGAMLVGGLAGIATIPVVLWGGTSLQPLTVAFAVIGKAGASVAFAVVYIFTAELLPTVVRNASMGTCSCAARIGSMLAPYIAKSGELIGGPFGKVEPLVVFGVLSIIAGLLMLLLPETLNQTLPDTIEEGENFGTKKRRKSIDAEMTSPFEL